MSKKKNPVINCFPFSKDEETVVNISSEQRQKLNAVLNNFMSNEYGHIYKGLKSEIKKQFDEVVAKKKALNKKLQNPKTPKKEKVLIGQQLKKALVLQGNLRQEFVDFDKKVKVAKKLVDLIRADLTQSIEHSYGTLDVEKVGLAMKEAMQAKTKVRFRRITNLKYLEINLLYNTYKTWFDKRNKGVDYKSYKGMSKMEWTMKDSMFVLLHNDKSLQGTALLQDVHNTLHKKSSKKIEYNRKYGMNRQNLRDFVYHKKIAYFPDPNIQPVDANDLTPFEETTSLKNLYGLEADLMDGRTKYIVPQPIGDLIRRSKTLKGKTSNAFDRYNEIVTYAINSGFHISKDIHEHVVGNEVYYYLTMKTVDKDGVEKYEAFIVPHEKDANTNRTLLIYPKTKKGKMNGKWLRAIKDHQNNTTDLVDTMEEGFFEAKTEKIFNGYNKEGNEIRVKGYSQYTKLDLTMNHPMFKKSRTFIGTGQTKNVSLWTTIKEMRELYTEVFEWFQNSNKLNHANLQKALGTMTNLKNVYIQKYNMTEDEASEAVQKIIDALKLDDVLYITEENNIKTVSSPRMINYSSGIKENYYPSMFTFNDNVADLVKAYEGAQDEIIRIQEQIAQKKHLISSSRDTQERRKLGTQLLALKERLITYEGDGKEKIGLLELLYDQIELTLGIRTESEVRKIPTQSMAPYAKHRKLYTNRLKDPDPSVLFGGRRSDPDVFSEYVEGMVNTTFNNELYSAAVGHLQYTTPGITDYLLEEVKTAVGRVDVRAEGPIMALGLVPVPFYVDYSNQRIVDGINNFLGKDSNYTIEELQAASSRFNAYTSGNTLGISVNMSNNMQEHFGIIVETQMEVEEQLRRVLEDQPLANELVDKGGVLDTVQSVADVFLSTITGELNVRDGFVAQGEMLLFRLARAEFVQKATKIRQLFADLIIRKRIEIKKDEYDVVMQSLLEGTWEAVNGIARGTVSDKWLQKIRKKTGLLKNDDALKIFVTWGMSSYGITSQFTTLKGLGPYLGMIEAEKRMRKNIFLRGVIQYADIQEPELRGNYAHPRAIAAGRQLVTAIMFNFSLQNFPKFFRGAAGQTIWKFKTYPYLQAHAEYQILNNFYLQNKNLPRERRRQEWRKLLTPSNAMLPDLFSYSDDEVNAFNRTIFNNPYIPINRLNPNIDTSTRQGATAVASRLIWSRGLVSFFFIGLEQFNLVRKFKQIQRALFLGSPNSMIRGSTSVIGESVLRTLKALLAVSGLWMMTDEDEDEALTQFLRIGTPLWINVLVESIKTGDPTRGLRLVANVYYKIANALGLTLSD